MDTPADNTLSAWIARTAADAIRRGLGQLVPLIESLGSTMASLRSADWNDDARSAARPDPRDREHLR
jgi:hypothetical protein